tara:strand:- start:142 stop:831 length:690 start_codon:yes stop_codon:yes gene_type:complete
MKFDRRNMKHLQAGDEETMKSALKMLHDISATAKNYAPEVSELALGALAKRCHASSIISGNIAQRVITSAFQHFLGNERVPESDSVVIENTSRKGNKSKLDVAIFDDSGTLHTAIDVKWTGGNGTHAEQSLKNDVIARANGATKLGAKKYIYLMIGDYIPGYLQDASLNTGQHCCSIEVMNIVSDEWSGFLKELSISPEDWHSVYASECDDAYKWDLFSDVKRTLCGLK